MHMRSNDNREVVSRLWDDCSLSLSTPKCLTCLAISYQPRGARPAADNSLPRIDLAFSSTLPSNNDHHGLQIMAPFRVLQRQYNYKSHVFRTRGLERADLESPECLAYPFPRQCK